MQHLISKLDANGIGVVVHNGSTLFSGDAGSAESNIRKWMIDSDIVESVIQLPTDEFFNTAIYTYLWVLNKNKLPHQRNKIMLINAADKFSPLNKNKGSKRKLIDEKNCYDIVKTLLSYKNSEYARIFEKEFFYFNKQAITLTNIDGNGVSFEDNLPLKENKLGEVERVKSVKLEPTKITQDNIELTEFIITDYDSENYTSLSHYYTETLKPLILHLNYLEHPLIVTTHEAQYYYDIDQESLIKKTVIKDKKNNIKALGCGKIVVKSSLKKATKKQSERIFISAELTPSYQKDFEIIPYYEDEVANLAAIDAFMTRYIKKPFKYAENVVGVELNFNKIFYKSEPLRPANKILKEISILDEALKELEDRVIL